MLSLVEQAFVGRDEKRAPLKTPAWEAKLRRVTRGCELLIGQEKKLALRRVCTVAICNNHRTL